MGTSHTCATSSTSTRLDWPTRADVLEVGCGAGWLWAANAGSLPPGIRLTLTDLSPGMLAAGVERVMAAGVDLADAQVADVQELPFASASFDVVVANHMLYHAPDPTLALAELARVVRRGGVLVAATNGTGHHRELGEIRAEVFGVDPLDDTVTAFGIESGRPILFTSFCEVEWRPYPDELRCTEPSDVVDYILSVPPGEGATDEQRSSIERAVCARFDAGAGTMTISKEAGLFVCRGGRV